MVGDANTWIAIATAIAAGGAWYAAWSSKKSSEAALLHVFMVEYSSDQMLKDMQGLSILRRNHPEDFADYYRLMDEHSLEDPHDPEVREILANDSGRRNVTQFFLQSK